MNLTGKRHFRWTLSSHKILLSRGPLVELVDTAVFKTVAVLGMRVRIPHGPPPKGGPLMAKDQTMKLILSQIEEKEAEIKMLSAQVAALRQVYDEASGAPTKHRAPRTNIKGMVLKLLDEVGEAGLNARKACELAALRGVELNPKSVSSLLSRLASDGVLWYDQTTYRLAQYKPSMPKPTLPPAGSVRPFPPPPPKRIGES